MNILIFFKILIKSFILNVFKNILKFIIKKNIIMIKYIKETTIINLQLINIITGIRDKSIRKCRLLRFDIKNR